MKILNYNAAILLFDKVKALSQHPHETWRCIYLNFSSRRVRYNEALRTHFVVKAISELMADNDGYIYLCEDGDIFVLFQGTLKPILAKLANHFADLDPNQTQNEHSKSLFTIFDMSKDWRSFYLLCENKYLEAVATADDSRAFFASYNSPLKHVAKTPSA